MSLPIAKDSAVEDLMSLAYVHPIKPWVHLRRQARWQVDGLPPLQTFDFELNMLRALLRKPTRDLYLSRHFVLDQNRWFAAERVARSALRDGCTPEDTSKLLQRTHSDFAPPDYLFCSQFAEEIVEAQTIALKKWVIYPGGAKGCRIVGIRS